MEARSLKTLLAKYNVPGPRYTSYPTVPAWLTSIGSDDYQQSLQQLKPGEHLSLYFHLPFCERLCHFCGCMKVITANHGKSAEYTDVLLSEIDRVLHELERGEHLVSQLHLGGGTPNFFQPEEITALIEHVRKRFQLLPDAELSVEMHPRTSTAEFCDNLKRLGFNRISLGIQDFDPEVQKLIYRHQTYEMTVAMIEYLRQLGFDSFNFDLIYGLPGQRMTAWRDTLQKVIELKPNRLAVYSYAHVPWVAPVQRSFKDSDLPSPELKLALFEEAYRTLTVNGYRLIGMDHFALKDDELSVAADNGSLHRNFMGYSTRADAHQIGFGISAISYVGGNYFQNLKKLPPYYEEIRAGELATFRGFLLNRDDSIRRDLITQIMCNGRVDFNAFEAKWGVRFSEYFGPELTQLDTFKEDGLLEVDEAGIYVIDHGFLFLRNIAMTFDTYLEGIRQEAETPTFSQTV